MYSFQLTSLWSFEHWLQKWFFLSISVWWHVLLRRMPWALFSYCELCRDRCRCLNNWYWHVNGGEVRTARFSAGKVRHNGCRSACQIFSPISVVEKKLLQLVTSLNSLFRNVYLVEKGANSTWASVEYLLKLCFNSFINSHRSMLKHSEDYRTVTSQQFWGNYKRFEQRSTVSRTSLWSWDGNTNKKGSMLDELQCLRFEFHQATELRREVNELKSHVVRMKLILLVVSNFWDAN
jgi:hypothetical protein